MNAVYKNHDKKYISTFFRDRWDNKRLFIFKTQKLIKLNLIEMSLQNPNITVYFATSIHAFLGVSFSWFSAFTKDDWLVSIQCLLDLMACTKCSIAHNSNDFWWPCILPELGFCNQISIVFAPWTRSEIIDSKKTRRKH